MENKTSSRLTVNGQDRQSDGRDGNGAATQKAMKDQPGTTGGSIDMPNAKADDADKSPAGHKGRAGYEVKFCSLRQRSRWCLLAPPDFACTAHGGSSLTPERSHFQYFGSPTRCHSHFV